MSYLGENKLFSFRDNYCEPISNVNLKATDTANFGRTIASLFNRFTVGCSDEKSRPMLYSLCAGIADSGKDVFLCENTELPVFKFRLPCTSSECGIFLSEDDTFTLSFYDKDGFPMNRINMRSIMENTYCCENALCGKITHISPFNQIYINSLRDSLNDKCLPINCGISCGNKKIRALWQEFFSDSDDTLILQISDDGQRVNIYSTEFGFISYDRLILAYSMLLNNNGHTVFLPDNFHYAAEDIASKQGFNVKRFNTDKKIPLEAINQRFTNDALYLCLMLLKDKAKFFSVIGKTPYFATAKREISVIPPNSSILGRAIIEPQGRIFISRSGKNNISLLAQAYNSETAAELCSAWNEKLRRLSSCTNLFHDEK